MIGLSQRGLLGLSEPPQELSALPLDDREGVGQARGRRGYQLQVELGEIGPWPAHLVEPLEDAAPPGLGQVVDLALRTI